MVEKAYEWADGATLEEHSRRKHRILREYFTQYLRVRLGHPQQTKFRFSIVDGFSGAGKYKCGSPGSPLIFVEVLRTTLNEVNIRRAAEGLALVEIDCLLILNDGESEAIELLKQNMAPALALARQECPKLHIRTQYLNGRFEVVYPRIETLLANDGYTNVVFNLDQCGHSHVQLSTIMAIMRSRRSVEIFYTFMIEALLAFLRKSNPRLLAQQLSYLDLSPHDLVALECAMSRKEWLGAAERIVFEALGTSAPYVSPFSIHNPNGWRYWFVHFANSYRARQVYNDILHNNASQQAHFGRPGLNMLSYNPRDEGSLYLFDELGRQDAKDQLMEDIPRLVAKAGDVQGVLEFYETIYKLTPAHTQDIHAALIDNPDIEVITKYGGARRKANAINVNDTVKLKPQRSFYQMFGT